MYLGDPRHLRAGATHSTSIMQGLDQEMPGPGTGMNTDLKQMVLDGDIPVAAVDDSVLRILTPMYEVGLFDKYTQWTNATRQHDDVTSKEHSAVARELAGAATVLLKNDGVLPLKPHVKTIAILGKNGGQGVTIHGGGSGQVQPTYVITPLQGLAAHYRPKAKNCTFRNDTDFMAYPSRNIPDVKSKEDCCQVCFQNYPSCMYFTFTPPSGCWLHSLAGNFVRHDGYVSGSCIDPSAGTMVNITYDDGTDLEKAVDLAKISDVAIVFVGTSSHEGADRTNLSFPYEQDALVTAVAKAAKGKTVVVAFTPGAALMPWAKDVSAALTMFMPGLEVGDCRT